MIPTVKRYGIPVVKSFLQHAAPEVLNILDGSTKPKTAMKNAVKKTIRQQIGGGRGRTKKKKVAAKGSRKPYFRKKTNPEKQIGKVLHQDQRKHSKRSVHRNQLHQLASD